ncbi:hypothetical protein AOQ84DRAFT_387899 [Glonium stellatum]|uniref:Uncharacterized protein n=1 Tax=Glonium stellatum TaxID=574774 RepID=A0A8E2F3W4_9PEZI|nr:hypothetical protein AOQ84DRAFT_387899 [Glonium stellatum]
MNRSTAKDSSNSLSFFSSQEYFLLGRFYNRICYHDDRRIIDSLAPHDFGLAAFTIIPLGSRVFMLIKVNGLTSTHLYPATSPPSSNNNFHLSQKLNFQEHLVPRDSNQRRPARNTTMKFSKLIIIVGAMTALVTALPAEKVKRWDMTFSLCTGNNYGGTCYGEGQNNDEACHQLDNIIQNKIQSIELPGVNSGWTCWFYSGNNCQGASVNYDNSISDLGNWKNKINSYKCLYEV